MEVLEGLKGESVDEAGGDGGASRAVVREKFVEDYTVQGPTLEEVFMNVARESGVAGANGV
jgi:hypothetical protein